MIFRILGNHKTNHSKHLNSTHFFVYYLCKSCQPISPNHVPPPPQPVEDFYKSLIEQENWYIYYINYKDSMISSAFVYESEIVDYLYNSCRDHSLEEFNTGTYLNDQLLQNSINNKKRYFDYLKGEEKYKFNFGGQVHQLYDLKIKV